MAASNERNRTDLTWWLVVSVITLAILLVVVGIGVDSQVTGGPGLLFGICLGAALVLIGLACAYLTARYLSTRSR